MDPPHTCPVATSTGGPEKARKLSEVTETKEPRLVGVALMGGSQAVYDIVFYQQLKPSDQEDTDIPYERRQSIIDGIRNWDREREKVEASTEDHDRDLHYLLQAHADLTERADNVDASLFDDAKPIEYPMWEYLENPGVRAYICPDSVYDLLGYGETNYQRETMVFVFDEPFAPEDLED